MPHGDWGAMAASPNFPTRSGNASESDFATQQESAVATQPRLALLCEPAAEQPLRPLLPPAGGDGGHCPGLLQLGFLRKRHLQKQGWTPPSCRARLLLRRLLLQN